MPVIRSRKKLLDKDVLIVGNGPSCRMVSFKKVRHDLGRILEPASEPSEDDLAKYEKALAEWGDACAKAIEDGESKPRKPYKPRGSGASREEVDLVLINNVAVGDIVPEYAVAVDPDALLHFQKTGLHEKTKIVCNAPHKTVGKSSVQEMGPLLSCSNLLTAPDDWPPHASGPLAVWAMASLGYRRIFIYGFDGTMHPNGTRSEILRRAQVWEKQIARFLRARRDAFMARKGRTGPTGPSEDDVPRLYRVWPEGAGWKDRPDPLSGALAGKARIVR